MGCHSPCYDFEIKICSFILVLLALIFMIIKLIRGPCFQNYLRKHRPLSKAQQRLFLQRVEYKSIEEGQGQVGCAICLTEEHGPHSLLVMPQCKHLFHEICILRWLQEQSVCPICKRDVRKGAGQRGTSR